MMIAFVTVEEAKAHLRIDDDAGDEDLEGKIYSASASVLDFVQGSRHLFVNESGEVIDTDKDFWRIKAATLAYVGILDRVRNGEEESLYKQGHLPFSVTAHIYSLRKPTIV